MSCSPPGQGRRADVIVTDTGSYSDLVFGLAHLTDREYRPALADLPDQKLWRGERGADYGALNQLARGRLNLDRVRAWWPEILRLVGSMYTGRVSPYDVVRMLQRDGHPTALGEAINTYGRIFKSLHVLAIIDDEDLRRGIKGDPQPPGGPPRPGRESVPRPQRTTVPAILRRNGRPARRAGNRVELPGPVEHGLYR